MTKDEIIKNYRLYFISMLSECLHINCHNLYRPQAVNIKILIDEIIDFLNSKDTLIRDHQLKIMLTEFILLTKKDLIFAQRFARDSTFLIKEVGRIKDKKNVLDDKDKLKKLFLILKYQIEKKYIKTLQGTLKSFFDDSLFSDSNLDLNKGLKKLNNLTHILLSELLYDKYTRKFLDFVKNKYYYNNENNLNKFRHILDAEGGQNVCK